MTTYTLTTCVQVRISGTAREFPKLPEDDGTVLRFVEWKMRENILEAVRGGMSGPGIYVGFFDPSDMPRIVQWLTDNGCAAETES